MAIICERRRPGIDRRKRNSSSTAHDAAAAPIPQNAADTMPPMLNSLSSMIGMSHPIRSGRLGRCFLRGATFYELLPIPLLRQTASADNGQSRADHWPLDFEMTLEGLLAMKWPPTWTSAYVNSLGVPKRTGDLKTYEISLSHICTDQGVAAKKMQRTRTHRAPSAAIRPS